MMKPTRPLLAILPNEYFAKLNFICVNSENKVVYEDLNKYGNLLSKYNFKKDEMVSIISSVIPYLKNGKKLFIFRSMKDAKKGSNILKNIYGIHAPISDSKSDPNSELVDKFKNNGLDNLCVVDRMRLGYSDNLLYYTIDMSFTHNPDMIYQIMSRSNRGDQSMSKYYIKVTNNKLNEYTRLIVSIALALFKSENIVKYNGNNFKGIMTPVLKKMKLKKRKKSGDDTRYKVNDFIIPDVLDDIITFFNSQDYVDGGEVIRILLGKQNQWTKEDVIKLADGKSKKKFRKLYCGAYDYARRNGFLNELNLVGLTIWTKKDVIKIADGMNKTKFRRLYSGAFVNAKKNGYLNELNLVGQTIWTKEDVVKLADGIDGMNKTEFIKLYGGAYDHAKRNKYLNELNLSAASRRKWKKEDVIKIADGMNKTKFIRLYGGAYSHAKRNKYLNELNFKK